MIDTNKKTVVYLVTTKTGDGECKIASGRGYYSSFLLPSETAKAMPNADVLIVDVDNPVNKEALKGNTSATLQGFKVDGKYAVETHYEYASKLRPISKENTSMVVPYLSAEADSNAIISLSNYFSKNTLWMNEAGNLLEHSSKTKLIDVKNDVKAKSFSRHILPNVVIKSEDDYNNFKKQHPEVVIRVPKSTESVGVYIKSEIEQAGINNLLKQHGDLLATTYFPTEKSGDLRVYAWYDGKQAHVSRKGCLRSAPKPTLDNPHPKCNVSSGGSVNVVDLTPTQMKLAKNVMEYYGKNLGLRLIGFDLFSINETETHVVSEVNFSPDGIVHAECDKAIVNCIKTLCEQTKPTITRNNIANQLIIMQRRVGNYR